MCVCFGDPCAQNFKLRDYFERILCWLDHWLSCMLDCIHDCVFLLSKKWFLKVARFLLDTSSTPCYLSSFSSFFISQSRQLLDTWWIDRESSCLVNSFSTPGGSIELLFLDLMSCSSILTRHLSCQQAFSRHLPRQLPRHLSTSHLSRFTECSI